MGERTIKEWFCDRCKTVMDKKPVYGEMGQYSIVANADYMVAGGNEIEWRELCPACNSYVGALIRDLKHDATPLPAPFEQENGK